MSSNGYTELEAPAHTISDQVNKKTRYIVGFFVAILTAACLACLATFLNKYDFNSSPRTTFLGAIDLISRETPLPETCILKKLMAYCQDKHDTDVASRD